MTEASPSSSPCAALQRRFQALQRPASQQTELNKLLASMTLRAVVTSSAGHAVVKKALAQHDGTSDNLSVTAASTNLFSSSSAASSSSNVHNAQHQHDKQTPRTPSSARSSSTAGGGGGGITPRGGGISSMSNTNNKFYASLANMRSTNFEQCHADVILKNPQAPTVSMGDANAGTTNKQSSSSSPSTSTSSAFPQQQQQHHEKITAMMGVPSALSDDVFVASLQRRAPTVMPRLVVTCIRAIEDLVGACPVPAAVTVKNEIARRVGVLSGMLAALRRSHTALPGNEWDVLFSRVLHKLMAAALSNDASDLCVILRENAAVVFPENERSLRSFMITQLASRSAALTYDHHHQQQHHHHSHSSGGGGGGATTTVTAMSPAPKHADPASPVPPPPPQQQQQQATGNAIGTSSSAIAAAAATPTTLPPLAVLLALSESVPLPSPKSSGSLGGSNPPTHPPTTPLSIIGGCAKILQSTENPTSPTSNATTNHHFHQHHQLHVSLNEGTWNWIVQAFRELERELFDVNGALNAGMCSAANVLQHASAAGPQKFATGIGKILETPAPPHIAPQQPQERSFFGRATSNSNANNNNDNDNRSTFSSPTTTTAAATSTSSSSSPQPPTIAGLGAASTFDSIDNSPQNITTSSLAAHHHNVARDTWTPLEIQALHLRRSCSSYSPSSLLAVQGRRRDAIAAACLLAVTTLRAIACASALSHTYFTHASKVSMADQKMKVPILEAIAGCSMRLAGLALTSCNHLVASLADRIGGKALFNSTTSSGGHHLHHHQRDKKIFCPPSFAANDPLVIYSPLPLLQLSNHCLLFLGSVPQHPTVADQLHRLAGGLLTAGIPQAMAINGLTDETQKLLASTFFFFIRSTPLTQCISIADPVVFAMRNIELCLKGFKNKAEVVRALGRLEQRRNFGRLLESIVKTGCPACSELVDTFVFLKSLPKGEQVLRHMPLPLSVMAAAVALGSHGGASCCRVLVAGDDKKDEDDDDEVDDDDDVVVRESTPQTQIAPASAPTTPAVVVMMIPPAAAAATAATVSPVVEEQDHAQDEDGKNAEKQDDKNSEEEGETKTNNDDETEAAAVATVTSVVVAPVDTVVPEPHAATPIALTAIAQQQSQQVTFTSSSAAAPVLKNTKSSNDNKRKKKSSVPVKAADTTTQNNNNNPELFTSATPEQIAWVARGVLSHVYHRLDSHNDIPRSSSAVYASSIDPTVVLLGKKRRRVVCVKKSTLMAPWRVLLPSVETRSLLVPDDDTDAARAASAAESSGDVSGGDVAPPYPAVGWVDAEAQDDAGELDWGGLDDDE